MGAIDADELALYKRILSFSPEHLALPVNQGGIGFELMVARQHADGSEQIGPAFALPWRSGTDRRRTPGGVFFWLVKQQW